MKAQYPRGHAAETLVAFALLAAAALTLLSCATSERRAAGGGAFERGFEWQYRGRLYRLNLELRSDVYDAFKRRERTRDYDLFASDQYSKPFVRKLTLGLRDYARSIGLEDDEIPHFIVSFVQNLPYTSDDVTTGFDEYPRFPYETFYDNGGDCEDTSILASAMLHELGYAVALLLYPGHMAVGVECRPTAGQAYYTHQGTHYCFLETTGENWEIGDVPPNLHGLAAVVTPVVERPVLRLSVDYRSEYVPSTGTTVDVDVSVTNLGSQPARRTQIYVALQTNAAGAVGASIRSRRFRLEPERSHTFVVTDFRLATGKRFRVYVRASAAGAISDEMVSEWIGRN